MLAARCHACFLVVVVAVVAGVMLYLLQAYTSKYHRFCFEAHTWCRARQTLLAVSTLELRCKNDPSLIPRSPSRKTWTQCYAKGCDYVSASFILFLVLPLLPLGVTKILVHKVSYQNRPSRSTSLPQYFETQGLPRHAFSAAQLIPR